MALDLLWAVLASVASSFAVGMLWYGMLFAKPWMAAMGWERLSKAEIEMKQKQAGPGYAITIVMSAISAAVMWYLFDWMNDVTGADAILNGLILGFLGWVAFYLPGKTASHWFEGHPFVLLYINAGFFLVQYLLTGLWVGFFAG